MLKTSPAGRFTSGYLGLFHFDMENNESVQGVLEQAVRDWLSSRKRGADVPALDDWDGLEDIALPSGATIEAVSFKDERSGQDCIRYELTDEASKQGAGGQYQVTILGAANPKSKKELDVMVQVGRNFGTEAEVISATHPPALVASMLEARKVFDGATRLQGRPRTVLPHDIDEVVEAVADQRRRVPIILGVSPGLEADEKWRSIIAHLTRNAAGTAAVYAVGSAAVEALNERLPEALRTAPGHIRMIAPKVDFENPDMRRHPVWMPEEIIGWLGEDGRPTARAAAIVAEDPRVRLLDFGLPPALQRIMDLLDKKRREDEVHKAATQKAEAHEAVVAEERAAAKARAEAGAPAQKAAADLYPSRRERYARKDQDSFWFGFKAQLARWLGKPLGEISEETVEADLIALEERLAADSESLRLTENYLDELEAARIVLLEDVGELRDQRDSLEAQLVATQQRLKAANSNVVRLEAQLERHSLEPQQKTESENGARLLGQLKDKLQEVNVGGLNPHLELGEALNLLRERLDPLIQSHLEDYLQGNPWTVVLEDKDVASGRNPGTHNREDPAAQLRMLTERIEGLGYPFDIGGTRFISTTAQTLRDYRNRWSHHHDLEPEDPWRAFDAVYQLLAALGDDEGAEEAKRRRDEIPRP